MLKSFKLTFDVEYKPESFVFMTHKGEEPPEHYYQWKISLEENGETKGWITNTAYDGYDSLTNPIVREVVLESLAMGASILDSKPKN